jgi:hypothetical protein
VTPRYLYPQHPASGILIASQQLDDYEAQGKWLAQLKFQGSNCVVWYCNGNIAFWNRRKQPMTSFRPKDDGMLHCFRNLNLQVDTEYVFVGELLHTKVKSKITNKQVVDNTIVLFDILFVNKYLYKETVEERLAILTDICRDPQTYAKEKMALKVNEYKGSQLWLAETFYEEFAYNFWKYVDEDDRGNDRYPLIEGLMLKLKDSTNVGFGTKPIDVNWMVRCRKKKEKTYTL